LSSPRKLASLGIVLFFVGFALGGVGNQVSGALPVIPLADTLTALGFVLALVAASRAGSILREILVVGIVFGIGTFYAGEPHSTHIGSGLGFGVEHLTHIFIGLALMMTATLISVALTFYHTRRLGAGR
jgi:galactitol-specific phosphotransferase system IIC component